MPNKAKDSEQVLLLKAWFVLTHCSFENYVHGFYLFIYYFFF